MQVNETQKEPVHTISFFTRIQLGGEQESFAENLAMLLNSGMDASSALDAIGRETKSGEMKKIVGMIEADIAAGATLTKALAKTNLFSPHIMALIRTGEESGRLAENLKVIVIQLQKERAFRARVASAMMYPVFVLFLTLTIGVSLAWFVLPKLAEVFASLHLKLPLITQVLISIGNFLAKYGAVFVPSFIVFLALVIYFVFLNRKTNFIGQRILFGLPGVKKLIAQVELARFGYILGNLLAAGLPITDALASLEAVSSFGIYKKLYKHLRTEIEQGNSFQRSFGSYSGIDNLIPVTIQQMIIAAEQSGYLADALVKIGVRYEEMTDITTKDLSVILEPILLVVVALGVLGVAVAVILPIYSLVGGLNSGQEGSPAVSLTPTIMQTQTPPSSSSAMVAVHKIQVLNTQIGYLNIRQDASTTAAIIGKALPGDVYEYINKQGDWYQITFGAGKVGWVNATYVQVQ